MMIALSVLEPCAFSVVFATHPLEEAIFLANRIVAEELITPKRPHDVSFPESNNNRRRLAIMLHGDHARAHTREVP